MGGLPKWFNKDGQRQNDRSRRQENDRAKQQGGRTRPGSGSSWRAPGDVRTGEYLEELKFTDKASFSLKVRDWLDIRNKAVQTGREPRMVVDFPQHGLRLVITEEEL